MYNPQDVSCLLRSKCTRASEEWPKKHLDNIVSDHLKIWLMLSNMGCHGVQRCIVFLAHPFLLASTPKRPSTAINVEFMNQRPFESGGLWQTSNLRISTSWTSLAALQNRSLRYGGLSRHLGLLWLLDEFIQWLLQILGTTEPGKCEGLNGPKIHHLEIQIPYFRVYSGDAISLSSAMSDLRHASTCLLSAAIPFPSSCMIQINNNQQKKRSVANTSVTEKHNSRTKTHARHSRPPLISDRLHDKC